MLHLLGICYLSLTFHFHLYLYNILVEVNTSLLQCLPSFHFILPFIIQIVTLRSISKWFNSTLSSGNITFLFVGSVLTSANHLISGLSSSFRMYPSSLTVSSPLFPWSNSWPSPKSVGPPKRVTCPVNLLCHLGYHFCMLCPLLEDCNLCLLPGREINRY